MRTVRELSPDEQIRMNMDEAGKRYDGNFIFFTNSEEILEHDRCEIYGIPRIIAKNQSDFYDSGLSKKYKDSEKYGVRLYCSSFMLEENIPPVLAF